MPLKSDHNLRNTLPVGCAKLVGVSSTTFLSVEEKKIISSLFEKYI